MWSGVLVGTGVIPQDKIPSMEQGLRTNLPRELMAFPEKPATCVTHREVEDTLGSSRLLDGLSQDFRLDRHISYNSKVTL
jgi:hypothetical protein